MWSMPELSPLKVQILRNSPPFVQKNKKLKKIPSTDFTSREPMRGPKSKARWTSRIKSPKESTMEAFPRRVKFCWDWPKNNRPGNCGWPNQLCFFLYFFFLTFFLPFPWPFSRLRSSFWVMGLFRFFRSFHGQHLETSRTAALSPGYIQRRALSSSKFFNNGDRTVLPVLIVGAGPVGLVLSILLTKLGNTHLALYIFTSQLLYMFIVSVLFLMWFDSNLNEQWYLLWRRQYSPSSTIF